MNNLVVGNYLITEEPETIINKLQSDLHNGKLSTYIMKGSVIKATCPSHAEGKERHPSCFINLTSDTAPYLWAHCFTCGLSCSFDEFVSRCFDAPPSYGRQWLINNFGNTYLSPKFNLTDIELPKNEISDKEETDIDISKFESYHPYMKKRKLSDEVIEKFDVKYDKATRSLVFPVRDKHGKISFLTRRSVDTKKFRVDSGADKDKIYLLYDIINEGYSEVYICESQINALTLRSYGYPAIAMLGASCTDTQIDELNKTGVKHFICALDNDSAGKKGTYRLCTKLSRNKFVDVIQFNDSRDVNDLSKEEFDSLPRIDRSEYLRR